MHPTAAALRLSLARWGALLVALLLGAALVASAIVNYRDARFAAQAIAERQGFGVHRRMRSVLDHRSDSRADALQRAVDDSAGNDVHYLAIWTDGRRVAQAGVSAFGALPPTLGQLQIAGPRARMTFPHRSGTRGAGGPGGGFERGGPSSVLVMEFEPIGTVELGHRALIGLWLSSGAAILLTSAALFVWLLGRRAERMRAELEQQRHLASLGGMSAVLAHEIRNPLASLKGHAQLLAEKVTDPLLEARVRRVVDETLRLEALTNDLLEFARTGTVRSRPCAPIEVLRAAAQLTSPERIEIDETGAPATWNLDPARMQQVLINLLENAVHVTPDGKSVTASARGLGDELVFAVRDHGPGVPAGDRSRVFEPFHTTKTRGTGLGLAVARRVVDLHGGRIEIQDADGGGALFRVSLPATR